jgi:putative addiction module CopG family antidote
LSRTSGWNTFINCHNYDGMAMTSLNVSLPKVLKNYVEGQVASGDRGTPSEYVRELIRQDNERRLVQPGTSTGSSSQGPEDRAFRSRDP